MSASLSIVIPARDEAKWLPATIASLDRAREGHETELIVVDNASRDETTAVARAHGARVVHEPRAGIGRARNAGARAAQGEVLVFVDADVTVPPQLLTRVAEELADPRCLGGAADVHHRPRRPAVRAYLAAWRVLARALHMAQGGTQFWRRDAYDALGGYDEAIFMGEDVDLFWRARARGHVTLLTDVRVVPSPRRFDAWPLWRILVFTNPLVIRTLMRRRRPWAGWYEDPPR